MPGSHDQNYDRVIGALEAEQRSQRAMIDRLSDAVDSVGRLEPTMRALSEQLAQQRQTTENLQSTAARLSATVDGLQIEISRIREDQKEAQKVREDMERRQNALEMKQASALSRALPIIFAGLGSLAAAAAAVAAFWSQR